MDVRRVNRHAFSLAELLVVIAILVVLVGLLTPVFMRVKTRASQTVCASNLRQQFVTLSLYRDACGGTDAPAFSPAMGLPPFFTERHVVPILGPSAAQVVALKCASPVGYPDGNRKPDYFANWPICTPIPGINTLQVEAEQQDWQAYVQREGSGAIIMFDPNHQKHFPATNLSNQFAMGMTIAGGLKTRTRRGDCTNRLWWEGD